MKKTTVFDGKYLESAIYQLSIEPINQPFYASLLQELAIRYTTRIPTAAIVFDKEKSMFWVEINYEWFSSKPLMERTAVLFHEVLHFTHNHIFRAQEFLNEDKRLLNIAQDMSINQYITNLPGDCVDVKKFTYYDDKNKEQPFPAQKIFEFYLDILKQENKTEKTKEQLERYQEFDVHDWFDNLSETDKKKFLEQMKDVCQRTIDKTQFGFSNVPEFVKDLIRQIDAKIANLDYKKILAQCIKKTASSRNRSSTWNRPNKRVGVVAPGTTNSKLPKIHFWLDVSGSISYKEINEFLKVVEGFLKVGENDCKISFWDTEVHNTIKFKAKKSLNSKDITSGGTDVECATKLMEKLQPNLSVFLTDGYFSSLSRKYRIDGDILWVISKEGNSDKSFLDKLPGRWVKMA